MVPPTDPTCKGAGAPGVPTCARPSASPSPTSLSVAASLSVMMTSGCRRHAHDGQHTYSPLHLVVTRGGTSTHRKQVGRAARRAWGHPAARSPRLCGAVQGETGASETSRERLSVLQTSRRVMVASHPYFDSCPGPDQDRESVVDCGAGSLLYPARAPAILTPSAPSAPRLERS